MRGCSVTADEEWSGEWMENVETNRIREGRMEFFFHLHLAQTRRIPGDDESREFLSLARL
jgi:hypothetical protein